MEAGGGEGEPFIFPVILKSTSSKSLERQKNTKCVECLKFFWCFLKQLPFHYFLFLFFSEQFLVAFRFKQSGNTFSKEHPYRNTRLLRQRKGVMFTYQDLTDIDFSLIPRPTIL